jgi:hypothetical protein
MNTRGSFPGAKQPGREADHSPPSSAQVKECVELYLHYPNTPSWRGAQLKKKHRDKFILQKIEAGKVWSNRNMNRESQQTQE